MREMMNTAPFDSDRKAGAGAARADKLDLEDSSGMDIVDVEAKGVGHACAEAHRHRKFGADRFLLRSYLACFRREVGFTR